MQGNFTTTDKSFQKDLEKFLLQSHQEIGKNDRQFYKLSIYISWVVFNKVLEEQKLWVGWSV